MERATKTQARDLEQRDQTSPGKPLMITPALDVLPVYARGGSIVPVEPLVQNTEETPRGPLTLRIYLASDAATPCAGEVYTDDGHSFNFRKGDYARVAFTCSRGGDGALHIRIALQQGSFVPWWTATTWRCMGVSRDWAISR